jgi:hypothetical protein
MAIASTETTIASRLSLLLREALLASSSCLAANLASLSRSEDFPTGCFVKVLQLPVYGLLREFTKLFCGFLIALCL